MATSIRRFGGILAISSSIHRAVSRSVTRGLTTDKASLARVILAPYSSPQLSPYKSALPCEETRTHLSSPSIIFSANRSTSPSIWVILIARCTDLSAALALSLTERCDGVSNGRQYRDCLLTSLWTVIRMLGR